jgi:hypothetical protein
VLLRDRAGAQNSQSPAKGLSRRGDGASISLICRVSDLNWTSDTGKCPCSRQKTSKNTLAAGPPDQYRATMMIATTRNAAITDSTRLNLFDRRGAGMASIGGITQTPCTRFRYCAMT